jgi:hypothetical protein
MKIHLGKIELIMYLSDNNMTVIDLQNLEVDKFKLGKSGRAIKLFYDKEPVQICTSTMYLPFGVKSVSKEWSNYSEYNMDCFLNNSTSDISITFRESIEKLDSIIRNLVKENLTLFDSKTEKANENFIYNAILRENGSYPKLMRLQLSRDRNGNFESVIFDESKKKIKIDEHNIDTILTKGKNFKTIIECVKIWHYNGKVGSIWNIVQLKFSEKTLKEIEPDQRTVSGANVYNQLLIIDD